MSWWNRVESGAGEWMASKNPSSGEPCTLECPVHLDGLDCIVGAGWVVSAMTTEYRAAHGLVDADAADQAGSEDPGAVFVLPLVFIHRACRVLLARSSASVQCWSVVDSPDCTVTTRS